MPAPSVRVSDAIEQYLNYCQSPARGNSPATWRSKRISMDRLLDETGNILMKNVGPAHIDDFFETMRTKQYSVSTTNQRRSHVIDFLSWAERRGFAPRGSLLMEGSRHLRDMPKDRLRIPASEFAYLLDRATHPRDRIIVALGLYLFIRGSEVWNLRMQDVSLSDGLIRVQVFKTKQLDYMPISSELDEELRRWLTWYTERCGTPRSEWFIAPKKSSPKFVGTGRGVLELIHEPTLVPHKPYKRPFEAVQRALDEAGYALRHEDGTSTREGVHTLRRSGARARYDELIESERGYDGALREVQAMLHHGSTQMTERYLGITLDIKKRDEAIRGKKMFPSTDASKIVSISRAI